MEATNIKATETINATLRVESTSEPRITAHVRIGGGKVDHIENGQVEADGQTAVTFSQYGENSLNVNFSTASNRTSLLAAIETFVTELRNNAATLV